MNLNKAYFALIIMLLPFFSQAQERGIPVYSDYLTDNLYLLHPSMAGTANANKIRLTARQQWFDVDEAPSLQTLSINGSLTDNIGVGAILFNDQNGRFSEQGAYLTFAYQLKFAGGDDLNMLSFGLNAGVGQEKVDMTDLVGGTNPGDPSIPGGVQSDAYFNVDFGLSYFYYEFFAHFTVKNIIPQSRDIFFADDDTDELTNQRQYVGSLGYVIAPFGSKWSYIPSVMVHMKDRTQETNFDINFKVFREFDFGALWGGLSYRRSLDGAEFTEDGTSVENQKLQYITPFLGINYNQFMFAYTYSYQANSIVLSNSGFHQITLGYNFGGTGERFECNCPAVNF